MKLRSNDFDNLFSTTLPNAVTAGDLTIYLNSVPTNATEGFLVLDAGNADKREVIYYNAVGINYVSCPASGGRGQGGTSAVSHDEGAAVKMNLLREHLKPIRDAVFSGWVELNYVPLYASANTITIPGDVTPIFTPGRKIKLVFATSGAKYFKVVSSSYSSPNTTVTLSNDTVLNEVISTIERDLSPQAFSNDTLDILSILNPIGTIREFNIATNPTTLLGFGTWAEYGKGKVTVAINASDTEFDTLEETGGEKTHLLTGAESGTSVHGHGVTDPGHYHRYRRYNANGGDGGQIDTMGGSTPKFLQYENTDTKTTGITVNNSSAANAASAHNNLQPYIVVYRWVRTA